MNVVSRIQFPRTPEASSLYIKCNEGASLNIYAEHEEVALTKNGVVSLNTYFNSFYETYYAQYTKLESLYYLLRLKGDFQVALYRERYGQENRELIYNDNFNNCQLGEPIKIMLPDSWRSKDAGRIYLEINCLSDQGSFTEGYIATEESPVREVSLGIISCTFKKEAYIKKTVDAVLKDDFLQSKKLKIFVVDNGRTLNKDDFPEQNFELISNRNVGGSGGFTRGLIQALQEDVYTHFLFMDDDIELDSESIYRLFSLYEYAKEDICVAGSMLDMYRKNMLFEAGGLYNCAFNAEKKLFHYHPFSVAPLKHKLDLDNPEILNSLLLEEKPDFGAFWFFAFSKKTVQEIGLPLPLFIKLDDIEFSLRIKEHFDNIIVAFPSLAVWHEPFYTKDAFWERYYWYRNHLITHAMHGSLTYSEAVKFCTKRLIRHLMLFDYSSSAMLMKGFEDYLKGPNFLKTTEPESLHREVLTFIKNYKSQNVQPLEQKIEQVHKKSSGNFLQKLMSTITLNGHLLPKFLIKDDEVRFWVDADNANSYDEAFLKRRIAIFRDKNAFVYRNELDRTAGIKLLVRWIKVALISLVKWSAVVAEWKSAAKDLTSVNFWQDYLQLEK